MQTATRLTEFLVLDLALEEILYDNPLWEHFDYVEEVVDATAEPTNDEGSGHSREDLDSNDQDSQDDGHQQATDSEEEEDDLEGMVSDLRELSMETDPDNDLEQELGDVEGNGKPPAAKSARKASQPANLDLKVKTGGTAISIWEDSDDENEPTFTMLGRSKTAKEGRTTWGVEIINFLNELQNLTADYLPKGKLPVYTEHRRGSLIYHAHPNYRGNGFWRDWTLVDWVGYGVNPAHIWCFVELQNMPKGRNAINYGGILLTDGVYGVVESAEYDDIDDQEDQTLDLFTPLTLEVEGIEDGEVTGRIFFLADVEAFVGPCIVIPDIGGPPNAYFQVKNRTEWSSLFVSWLREPHAEMIQSDAEEEEEEGATESTKGRKRK